MSIAVNADARQGVPEDTDRRLQTGADGGILHTLLKFQCYTPVEFSLRQHLGCLSVLIISAYLYIHQTWFLVIDSVESEVPPSGSPTSTSCRASLSTSFSLSTANCLCEPTRCYADTSGLRATALDAKVPHNPPSTGSKSGRGHWKFNSQTMSQSTFFIFLCFLHPSIEFLAIDITPDSELIPHLPRDQLCPSKSRIHPTFFNLTFLTSRPFLEVKGNGGNGGNGPNSRCPTYRSFTNRLLFNSGVS